MTSHAQEVLRDALALPVNERADVAAEVEAAWAAEIERRARRVMSGESQGISWQDVRARGEAELRKK